MIAEGKLNQSLLPTEGVRYAHCVRKGRAGRVHAPALGGVARIWAAVAFLALFGVLGTLLAQVAQVDMVIRRCVGKARAELEVDEV